MVASRNEAVTFAAFLKIALLSEEERERELYNAKCEVEIAGEAEPIDEVKLLRQYIQVSFERYTNTYIETFFSRKFGMPVTISGQGPELYTCPCCNYRTLAQKS